MSDKILKPFAAPNQKVIKQDVFEAADAAANILDQARREAAFRIEEAGREIAAARARAVEEGREAGLQEWHDAVQRVLNERARFLSSCEAEAVRLAVRVAGKILGEQVRLDPQSINSIVAEALRSCRRERDLTISVHPDLVDTVRGQIADLEQRAGRDASIRVVGNSAVDFGGCLIESELGTTDARLETQLRCLETALLRETQGTSPAPPSGER
jgi:type III secretion system HrpE/YscL family protein